MELLPQLPKVAIPGPKAKFPLGRTGNLLSFFGDPAGTLLDLHRRYGTLAALTDGDPAVVFAFGGEHHKKVLSDSKLFHNFADPPYRVAPDSSTVRLTNALTSMNGDVHKRQRRLVMPAFQKSAVEGHRDAIIAATNRILDRWKPGDTIDVGAQMIE